MLKSHGYNDALRDPESANMPQSMPSASVLLTAAMKYLEEELLPTLTGYHRFKTRVTANVLNIVRRELELRDTQSAAERDAASRVGGTRRRH